MASTNFTLCANSTGLNISTLLGNTTGPVNSTVQDNSTNVIIVTITSNPAMSESLIPPAQAYNQTITFLEPDGSPYNITWVDLYAFQNENNAYGLMMGVQLGLSCLMLVTLLLLTAPIKRRSAIFASNVTALGLDILRSTLEAVWLMSAWNIPYAYFSQDNSRITRGDVVASILVPAFKVIEAIAIEVSLLIQVRTVLLASRRWIRLWLFILVFSLAIISVGVEIALLAINATAIASFINPPTVQQEIAEVANIVLTIGIGVCMLIFVTKLGYAIKNRKTLGIKRIGPMQAIFIMGAQTMIVPVIFAILVMFMPIDISGLTITMVAVSLPLSSLWAATNQENDHTQADRNRNRPPTFAEPRPMRNPLDDIKLTGLGTESTDKDDKLVNLSTFGDSGNRIPVDKTFRL